jgi:hypothetical protein
MRARSLLLFSALALFACKRKPDVSALDKDDGRGKTKDCALVAGGRIVKDTTIQASCLVKVSEPYSIQSGATLRIEPGARLEFAKGARIVVEDGAIVAQGDKQRPIVFTSAEKAPSAGDWGGLVFASSKPSTLLSVVVEYAGDEPKLPAVGDAGAPKTPRTYGIIGAFGLTSIDDVSPLADRKPAIYLGPEAKLTMADSVVRKAVRVGLAADGDAPFERFEGNRFEDDGGYALDVPGAAMGKVTSIDGTDPVRVRGTVKTTQTWPKVPAGIVVGSLRVAGDKENVVLTLAPESVLRVQPKVALHFGSYSSGGAIVAKKVVFTSAVAKPAPGDWAGIRFGKYAPGTSLDGCTIEYAGWDEPTATAKTASKTKTPERPKMSALLIEESMKDFAIVRTTFRNNAGPGMGKSSTYSGFISLFGGGTGGCEGLDNPKNQNKSIGQPLCEYHEDPMKPLEAQMLGVLGDPSMGSAVLGSGSDDSLGYGFGKGLGAGGGSMIGGSGGGGGGAIGIGAIGKGGGAGKGGGGIADVKTKP